MEENLSTYPSEAALCSSCFTKIGPDDAFCNNCGYPLKGIEEEQRAFTQNRTIKEIDFEDYKKKIKQAGYALYWVAVACFLSALIMYFANKDDDSRYGISITYLVLTMVFVALAGWSKKKPLPALISGASLYAILLVLSIIDNPMSIVSGIIVKIIIIGAFIKGIKSAIGAESIKKEFNIQ